MHTSPLRSSQRARSLSTLILSERSPRYSSISIIKSPRRRGQYKLFEVHNDHVTPGQHLVHLGDKSPRVMNTRRSSMKWVSWRSRGSLESEAQISHRKLRFEWSMRERSLELKRVSQCACNLNWVANWAMEVWGPSIAPKGINLLGCQRPRHVQTGGWTCSAKLSGTRPRNRTSLIPGLNPG
jgi:hypothetical protein